MDETILVVDDDANLLAAMRRQLRSGFTVKTAGGGEEALALIGAGERPAVILCDMRMGGINGVETLRLVKEQSPDTVRLMLTGNADMQTAIDAINNGSIFRFLTKPCPPDILEAGLRDALAQHRLIVAERELLELTLSGSVKVLTDVLAMVSPESFGRASRVRGWIKKITVDLKLPERWQLDLAGLLAPLGLLSVPAEVVQKLHANQPLNTVERAMIERSPEAAANLIANIPRLAPVARIVLLQNRGFDGNGFPDRGPQGTDIPFDARVLHILNDLALLAPKASPSRRHFAVLEGRLGEYDPNILGRVRTCLEGPDDEDAAPASFRIISTTALQPGMILAEDIVTKAGRLVLAALEPIAEVHIERLRNLVKLDHIADAVSIQAT